MKKLALLLAMTASTLLASSGCRPPQGGAYTGNDPARLSVVRVQLTGRGDRGTVENAVVAAVRNVRCPRVTGNITLFLTMGSDGQVARLDYKEGGGGITQGQCILPQLRPQLAGSGPAGSRITVELRAD